MTLKVDDVVMYEGPATFEDGVLEISIDIVKIKSLVWIHDKKQFIDKDGNFYFEYRVRKIFRDGKTINNDDYDLNQITEDTKKIKEEYDKSRKL